MSTKFKTHFNYIPEVPKMSELPSMTVPDQALTVREILKRHMQGKPLEVSSNMSYTGDNFAPEVRGMDLVDLQNLRDENMNNIMEMRDKLSNPVKDTDEAATEKTAEVKSEASTNEGTEAGENEPKNRGSKK